MPRTESRKYSILGLHAMSGEQLLERILAGFPASMVERVASLGLDRATLHAVLGNRSTIQRRIRSRQRLTPVESDRLTRVAAVIALSEDVLGSLDKALEWLQRDSVNLAGQGAPIRLLVTSQGMDLVTERLEQIRYGIYA